MLLIKKFFCSDFGTGDIRGLGYNSVQLKIGRKTFKKSWVVVVSLLAKIPAIRVYLGTVFIQ